ncbi:MAG: type IV secretory system conjugative DNA transfer family protein, partial [Actinomycetota bacterium]
MSRRGTIRADSRSVPVTWLDPVAGSPIEIAVGGLFLTAGALIAMVWGAAWLSSLLVTGQAAELSVGDAAVATARLGRNQLSWDGVWSAEIDAALAGPRWFWLFFAIEALLVALLFWPAWRLLGPRPAEPMAVVIEEKAPTHPRKAQREQARRAQAEARAARLAATAATGADPGPPPAAPTAGKIVVDGPTGTRLVLGRVGDTLVATEKHHSVLALGPTRSGKTSGLALPGLLEWAGPALVISAKSDLITMAWKARSKREGRTWLYDPTSSMANASTDDKRSFQGNQWSPLHVIAAVPQPRNEPELDRRVKQWSLSRRSAAWLVGSARTAAEPGGASGGDARFVAAEQLLAPLLLAAAAEERPIDQVVAWVDRRDLGAVRSALDRTGVAEALASWESAHRYDDATTTAAYQILTSALFPFGDPVVAAQAQEPEISARALLDGDPNTLFVLATPHQQGRLRPVVNTLVQEVFEAATAAATVTASARSARPLLIVIDDAAACLSAGLVEQMAGR